ncbi:MAG: type II toxin-antitoxin system PemK/MazF family toxin [Candidatus Bathyarchaeota archaeon]|nr:type II toxin-antitoxin system PemK/MazF family toxin [Candidatus Bathyarchaeota archaeon]
MKGKIVLITFPFTDLTSTKLRPALVLYESEKDVMVVFISSRKAKATSKDVMIAEKHPEFKQTGLKVDSFLKIEKIATLSKRLIVGELGHVGPKLRKEINSKVTKALKL